MREYLLHKETRSHEIVFPNPLLEAKYRGDDSGKRISMGHIKTLRRLSERQGWGSPNLRRMLRFFGYPHLAAIQFYAYDAFVSRICNEGTRQAFHSPSLVRHKGYFERKWLLALGEADFYTAYALSWDSLSGVLAAIADHDKTRASLALREAQYRFDHAKLFAYEEALNNCYKAFE